MTHVLHFVHMCSVYLVFLSLIAILMIKDITCAVAALKTFQATLNEYLSQAQSVFSSRTEESSAVQYFQVGVPGCYLLGPFLLLMLMSSCALLLLGCSPPPLPIYPYPHPSSRFYNLCKMVNTVSNFSKHTHHHEPLGLLQTHMKVRSRCTKRILHQLLWPSFPARALEAGTVCLSLRHSPKCLSFKSQVKNA